MYKKIWSLIVITLLLLAFLPALPAMASYGGNCGKNLNWLLDDEGTLTIRGTGEMQNYEIPVNGGVGSPWAHYEVKNIIIESDVSTIGAYAFWGQESLEEVVIPDNIISIGNNAFQRCSELKKVTLSKNITEIPYSIFSDCNHLIDIVIPNNVSKIKYAAFENCESLENIVIPNSVTSIGSSAFLNCISLKNIIIPNNVKSIGASAFSGCTGLKEIAFPNTIDSIGDGALKGCTQLEQVSIPFIGSARTAGGTSDAVFGHIFGYSDTAVSGTIEQYFSNGISGYYYVPSSLKSVKITDAVQVPYGAFYNCNYVREIQLNNGITQISGNAFYNCELLSKVTLPQSIEVIGNDTFGNCNNVTIYGFSGSYTEKYAKRNNIEFIAVEPIRVVTQSVISLNENRILLSTTANVNLSGYTVMLALYDKTGNLCGFTKAQTSAVDNRADIEINDIPSAVSAKVLVWDSLRSAHPASSAEQLAIKRV